MKKTYILLVTLFAVCLALPAMAQSSLESAIANKVSREVIKHHLKQAVCTVCGNTITTDHQHCPATNNTALCTTNDATENTRSAQAEDTVPSVCPICGHLYTIDEKYHGVEHECPHHTPTCAVCGEEIVTSYQHCPATDYTGLCTCTNEDPSQHQAKPQTNINKEEALKKAQALWNADLSANGHPEHTLEYYYEQVISGNIQ